MCRCSAHTTTRDVCCGVLSPYPPTQSTTFVGFKVFIEIIKICGILKGMAQAGQAGQNVAPLGTIFRGRAGQGHGRADGGFWGHPTDAVGVLGHRHRSQGGPVTVTGQAQALAGSRGQPQSLSGMLGGP